MTYRAPDDPFSAPIDRVQKHSPFIINGRPADLQPLPTIDVLGLDKALVPERRWIVPDMIPERNVTMVGGDGGMGKSQLLLQLLVAASLGKPWLGFPVRRCKSIGLFCEDDPDELKRRLADILRHYDASSGDLEDLTLVSRVGEENTLVQFPNPWEQGTTTGLYTRIQGLARDGCELLGLDSLHDLFAGNESSRPQARQFVNELRSLAVQMTTGAVVFTAHPSMSGRTSGSGEAGSTAWNNTVRSRLYLTSPHQDDGAGLDRDYRELKTMKANYARPGGVLKLRWHDGVFVRDGAPAGLLGTIERRSVEAIFTENLRRLASVGMRLASSKHAENYAPRVIAKLQEADGRQMRELEAAMWRLISNGTVHQVETGPNSKRRSHLETIPEIPGL